MANDLVEGCEPVTIEIVSAPANGVAIVNNPTGSVVFVPDGCYEGPDSFEYRLNSVSCGRTSNTATVAVAIESPHTLIECGGIFITCNSECMILDC